jgi:hypothetical protein
MTTSGATASHFPPFSREFLGSAADFTVIGTGALGGKATGLAFARQVLATRLDRGAFPSFEVSIPTLTVLATDIFDAFLRENDLHDLALSDLADDKIAHAFQKASLPALVAGDLRSLVDRTHQPLAVRSSSLLEDALDHPFAGVYSTKMIPNNQHDPDTRFRKLVEAIKFVYASTYFRDARSYIRAAGRTSRDEKMAVIIQEVVGERHGDRFYPHVSGVARSHNYYAIGQREPEEGVVNLALGLGKTIVDGGIAWSYSPASPQSGPPFASAGDLLQGTQTEFWAVNMGKPPANDPIRETEYLVRGSLVDAEEDGTLRHVASTYDPDSDRLTVGTGSPGPRAVTFAPLLRLGLFSINDLIRDHMAACRAAVGAPVEIEFALTLPAGQHGPARFGFLQVRPLVVSEETVAVEPGELEGPGVLVATTAALGNGTVDGVADIVYVRPETFDTAANRTIAAELDQRNRALAAAGRPYVLIGFGRWGSSDPWLGVPVNWAQISEAKVIVESSLPSFIADPSQGSHFFHNLTSHRILYFTVRHSDARPIDWEWLGSQAAVAETAHVRHVRLSAPLAIKADGRSGRGVIRRRGDGGEPS